ncbi:MAG TPA: DUF1839 family protein [Solirubrobacteraceae bacterium]|nr:DUF1839 family protein [Solirubrobacteraceae bacterium]
MSAPAATRARAPVALCGLDPRTYEPHRLHLPPRTYLETNCYADALIELVHARGGEPLAMLGFTLATDWDGDQFTYAKPPAADLRLLYGIDVHEMLPYRPLDEHIELALSQGRTLMLEADAWHLPDTAATSYRREHLKTTIVAEAIDPAAQRLRYLHNAGLFELEGEDYRGALALDADRAAGAMEPFCELVRFDAGPALRGAQLRECALSLAAEHLRRRPRRSPFEAWGQRLGEDLERLAGGTEGDYHAYAFVTVRMAGSTFELSAEHVDWLLGERGAAAAAHLRQIVETTKVLSFRLARRRPFDSAPAIAALTGAWEAATSELERALPCSS